VILGALPLLPEPVVALLVRQHPRRLHADLGGQCYDFVNILLK
jgi:hypothetical protein